MTVGPRPVRRHRRDLRPTYWSAASTDVVSPDGRHIYAHDRTWNSDLRRQVWLLLHPIPTDVLLARCCAIARESGFGGVSIRYLFTRCTTNQEELAEPAKANTPISDTYLAAVSRNNDSVMAAWKLRGGSSQLRSAVAARVRALAALGVRAHTADSDGQRVLSPTQYPDNLRIDGTAPLVYLNRGEMPTPPPPPRILLTGSREWTDAATISTTLRWAWQLLGSHERAVLVEGESPRGGADILGRDMWQGWSLPVDRYPPELTPSGRIKGAQRNAQMVRAGAQLCLGYPLPNSVGTTNCMKLAAEAGIPVIVVRSDRSPR